MKTTLALVLFMACLMAARAQREVNIAFEEFGEVYPGLLYESAVVYQSSVVYLAPVVYYAPVYYLGGALQAEVYEPAPCAPSTVFVIGSAPGSSYGYGHCGSVGSTVIHFGGGQAARQGYYYRHWR
jgi:hypothetical protein